MGHVCIIAEAGVNHNGDVEIAKKMVDSAKEAGADYIKFQTFIPERLVSVNAPKADYQKNRKAEEETQLAMLKKLAINRDGFALIRDHCQLKEIGFISTPFDMESISLLEEFNMDFWKLPSGEITNLPYLEKVAKTGKKIMMSTGMCSMAEVKEALSVLEKNGAADITLLHCNTQYPTPYEDVNLNVIKTLKDETGKKVGYSDHTKGIEVAIAAVALGAEVIEKHFTLDKSMEGPDHAASLEPYELKNMIAMIRNIENAMGSSVKEPSKSEKTNINIVRKSIVANRKIKKGEIFSEENITAKRPGTGISPMHWNEVIGREAIKDFAEDELIEL